MSRVSPRSGCSWYIFFSTALKKCHIKVDGRITGRMVSMTSSRWETCDSSWARKTHKHTSKNGEQLRNRSGWSQGVWGGFGPQSPKGAWGEAVGTFQVCLSSSRALCPHTPTDWMSQSSVTPSGKTWTLKAAKRTRNTQFSRATWTDGDSDVIIKDSSSSKRRMNQEKPEGENRSLFGALTPGWLTYENLPLPGKVV